MKIAWETGRFRVLEYERWHRGISVTLFQIQEFSGFFFFRKTWKAIRLSKYGEWANYIDLAQAIEVVESIKE